LLFTFYCSEIAWILHLPFVILVSHLPQYARHTLENGLMYVDEPVRNY